MTFYRLLAALSFLFLFSCQSENDDVPQNKVLPNLHLKCHLIGI